MTNTGQIILSDFQKLNIALSILGWPKDKYDKIIYSKTLEIVILEEIKYKLIKIPKGEKVEMNYSEQWAYGVLLMETYYEYQDL